MNYEDTLNRHLNLAMRELGINDYTIKITTEQAFMKIKDFEPKTIFFVLKYYPSTNTYEGKITPIQIIGLSEQDGEEKVMAILNKVAKDHNFELINGDTNQKIKQEFSTSINMSNFNVVGYGYRSVVSLSGTLYYLDGVYDLENLTIDNVLVNTLGESVIYSMSGNTQPVGQSNLATTVKNVATLSLSFTLPSMSTNDALITKIMNISSGTNADTTFAVSFSIHGVSFSRNMRLTSMQFTTAPNSIPSMRIGLML